MMFNLLYTAYPVIMMAVMDQDVRADTSLCYGPLYYPGLKGLLFNKTLFAASAWQGLWSAFVLVSVTIGILHILPSLTSLTFQACFCEQFDSFQFLWITGFPEVALSRPCAIQSSLHQTNESFPFRPLLPAVEPSSRE